MSLAQLRVRPLAGIGVAVGEGNWRFGIEALQGTTTWVPLTQDLRGCQWQRGAPGDPQRRPETGTAKITLDNRPGHRSADWSPNLRYYDTRPCRPGALVRAWCVNDPLNGFTTHDSTKYLTVLAADGVAAPLDMQVVMRVAAADWTPASAQVLAARRGSTGGYWQLNLTTAGALQLVRKGAAEAAVTWTSTANLSALANGVVQWIAVTYDADDDAGGQSVRFWTSTNGTAWTQFGTTLTTPGVLGVTMVPAADSPLQVGRDYTAGGFFIGSVYSFDLRSGIGSSGAVSTAAPLVVALDMAGLPSKPATRDLGYMMASTGQRAWAGYPAVVKTPDVFGFTVGTTWIPQFSGRVESWVESTSGLGKERAVTVDLVETIGYLAGINELASSTLLGGGESPSARFSRLLTAASWPYGFYADYVVTPTASLQSTDLADNRLAECHLAADSADLWFRSHRSGVAVATETDARYASRAPAQPVANDDRSIMGRAARDLFPTGLVFHPEPTTVAPSPWFEIASGKYLSIPNLSFHNPVSSQGIEVWIEVTLDSYASGAWQTLASKRVEGTNQVSWTLQLSPAGYLRFAWSTTGAPTYQIRDATAPIVASPRERVVIVAQLDVANGGNNITRFHVCSLDTMDARITGPYIESLDTQVGTTLTIAGVTSVFASTAPTTVGADPGGTTAPMIGRLHRLRVCKPSAPSGNPPTAITASIEIKPEDDMPDLATATSFATDTSAGSSTVDIVGSGVLVEPAATVYDADSLKSANDAYAHLSDVQLARAGGLTQTSLDISIRTDLGPRVHRRNDLICNTDSQVKALARRLRLRHVTQVYRPAGCRVSARSGPVTNYLPLIVTDLTDFVEIVNPAIDAVHGRVAAVTFMAHSLTPLRSGKVRWAADYEFDVYAGV